MSDLISIADGCSETDFPRYVPGTEEERKLVRKIDFRIVVGITHRTLLYDWLTDIAVYLASLHPLIPRPSEHR